MEAIEIKGRVIEEGKLIIEDDLRNKSVRVMLLIEDEEMEERARLQ